jgi:hypothetical protein
MASIRLEQYDLRPGALPPVCMTCGRPSTRVIQKQFSWHPPWVTAFILLGLLPYVIIALCLTWQRKVPIPVCEDHRGYFWKRGLALGLSIGLIVAVSIGLVVLIGSTQKPGEPPPEVLGSICAGGLVFGLIWLIAAAIVGHLTIRPKEITDRTITLANVHADFVAAVEEPPEVLPASDEPPTLELA